MIRRIILSGFPVLALACAGVWYCLRYQPFIPSDSEVISIQRTYKTKAARLSSLVFDEAGLAGSPTTVLTGVASDKAHEIRGLMNELGVKAVSHYGSRQANLVVY